MSVVFLYLCSQIQKQLLWTKSSWPRMLARKSLGLAELPHPLPSQGVQGPWPLGLVPAHLLAAAWRWDGGVGLAQ